MTTEQMRQALLSAYSSPKWTEKVKKMPDAQVFAVYTSMKNRKQI